MHLGFWDFLSQWLGVENCYYQLIDNPELLHALMRRLTDATIELIGQMNRYELFDTQSFTCHCSYTFSSAPSAGPSVSQNAWAFGMAQIFSSVSPEVTREFEVPYMQEVYSHFGSIYYGCCERLDDRLDVVEQMPNNSNTVTLRKNAFFLICSFLRSHSVLVSFSANKTIPRTLASKQ